MNIADIKQELSSDEKVLESAFKLETFYKKYKYLIWGVVIALILFFAGRSVTTVMEEARLEDANNAFLTLQNNPEDSAALGRLKEKNPALFELYNYAQAAKQGDKNTLMTMTGSQNDVIADASKYTAAVLSKETADSMLYKEMTLLQEAYLAIQSGDTKKAKEKLEMIDPRSPVFALAQLLKHSTIKAN